MSGVEDAVLHGLDETHDATLPCWVEGAEAHSDFPVQNLPLGIFAYADAEAAGGIAIGDWILDLAGLAATGLLAGDAMLAAQAASGSTLNALLGLGAGPRRALRRAVSALLSGTLHRNGIEKLLRPARDCTMRLPCAIGDYTDFYVGIHHALNIGRQFRPDNPLLPNYKHVPIGYHGRASSIRPSGVPLRRPNGQTKPPGHDAPVFGPSGRLDYELELGIWIGPGNNIGEPVPIADASDHVGGFCLLNDWSARDIQAWEYQPLGPFLAKNFATTISCWMVTPEALAPFRIAQPTRPDGDPAPLPYLMQEANQQRGAFDIDLEVSLLTDRMRESGLPPHLLSRSNSRHMYWTAAQLVAHHASGGCDLRAGDLFGTGTLSGPDPDSVGSLLETTLGGTRPVVLQNGEQRRFLEDGDEVCLSARAQRAGFTSIGFGECRARVMQAG